MKKFILSIVLMLNLNAMAKIQQLELKYEKAVKFGNAVTFTLPYFFEGEEVYPFVIPFHPVQYIDCDSLAMTIVWEPYLCVDKSDPRAGMINLSADDSQWVVGSAFCKALGYKSGKHNALRTAANNYVYRQNYDQLLKKYKRFVHMNIRTGNFAIIRNLFGQEFERMTELTCYE